MGLLPLNRIVPGDCIDVMGRFPGDSIDLTVTSPPYDKLRDYEGYKFDHLVLCGGVRGDDQG